MRSIITVQVGQCGNQVGCAFWERILQEHTSAEQDHASTYVKPDGKVRSIMVDMEEGVLDAIRRSELGPIFSPGSVMSGTRGSGNNFAQGYNEHGARAGEFLELMRKECEQCDSIQAIQSFQSLAGGTGSGLGSRLVETIAEHYDYPLISTCVVSLVDVTTAPYNCTCSMASLLRSSTLILPFDNQQIESALEAAKQQKVTAKTLEQMRPKESSIYEQLQKTFEARKDLAPVAPQKKKEGKPFKGINQLIANSISAITASMRFGGEVNVDMSDIATNLIPYRRLNIGLVNYCPIQEQGTTNITSQLKQLFSLSSSLSASSMQSLQKTTLANILFCRSPELDLGLLTNSFEGIQKQYEFLQNISFKVGITTGGVDRRTDFCWLRNGVGSAQCLEQIMQAYAPIRKAKSYLHHYLEFMELEELDARAETVRSVAEEYKKLPILLGEETTQPAEREIRERVESLVI